MNQHEWVRACLARYEEEGLTPEPGGGWQKAHYPAPKGMGEDTIWLLHDDHQVQGLLQSEEYGRCCFFACDAKRFLECGPFVQGWFGLQELYNKWFNDLRVKAAAKMNEVVHAEKDEQGRSIAALKASQAAHTHKDGQGRSLVAMKMNEVIHAEKDEQGRSAAAVKAGIEAGKKATEKYSRPMRVISTSTGEIFEFPSAKEAVRVLSLNQGSLCSVARGVSKQHKGYTAIYLDRLEELPKEED